MRTDALVREIIRDAAIGVGVADSPEGLTAIHHPGCAAAIWRRHPTSAFQSWIDSLDPELLPATRMILRPDAVRDAAAAVCDGSGTPLSTR